MWNFHRPGAGYRHVFTPSAFLLSSSCLSCTWSGRKWLKYSNENYVNSPHVTPTTNQIKWNRKFTANLGVGFESVLNVECRSTENGFMERWSAGRSAWNDQLIGTFRPGCTCRRVVDGLRQQKARHVLHRWARSEGDRAVVPKEVHFQLILDWLKWDRHWIGLLWFAWSTCCSSDQPIGAHCIALELFEDYNFSRTNICLLTRFQVHFFSWIVDVRRSTKDVSEPADSLLYPFCYLVQWIDT